MVCNGSDIKLVNIELVFYEEERDEKSYVSVKSVLYGRKYEERFTLQLAQSE